MAEYKLLSLLKSLNKKEHRQFKKFLNSPYFNTNKSLNKLYEIISDNEVVNNDFIQKEYVYKKLFPQKKYKDLHCRQYLSSLTKLLEKFIQIEHFYKNKDLQNQALLKEFTYKGSENIFSQLYSKTKPSSTITDGEYYYNLFRREDIRNQFLAYTAQNQNRLLAQPNYSETIQFLDTFYLIYKLKYCCELLNYKSVGALGKETILLDDILELLKKKDYSGTPIINAYYKILLTFIYPDEEINYYSLIDFLKENDHQFQHDDSREMYIYAQNFCIRQINKGKSAYLQELLNVYKILLKRKIIYLNNQLSPWDYKNIVVTGLRCQDYSWVKSFIDKYKSKLPEKEKNNAYKYNLAKYHFYQKEYNDVLKLLQKVEYNDIFYNLDSKAMLLKTYFEIEEYDTMYSLIESFKIFLRRSRDISKNRIKSYKNMLKIVQKISRRKLNRNTDVHELLKEIEKTKPLADANWLKSKAMELA